MPEKLKVVVIGAASPQWGLTLSRDLIVTLSDKRFTDSYNPVLMLEDIDSKNLEKQVQLALRITEKTGNRVSVENSTDQKQAIDGARFVLTSFAQGSLEAMQYDLEIPQEYGVFQPVGDTISIGGAIRAARNIPAILSIAKEMESVGHSDAWLLNLSNPMSMLSRAVTKETKVRTLGCCHELYGGIEVLAKCLDFPYDEWKQRLEFDVLGINHCGWMQYLKINGEDGFEKFRDYLAQKDITSEKKRLYLSHPKLARQNVKINLFLRYGVLPYSGDRHTSEFFREFVNNDTNKGADYGILLTTAQERLVSWRGKARANIDELLEGKKELDLTVSREAASRIIAGLLLGEKFYDVGNIPYHGDSLPGIPQGTVLERMVTYNQDGAVPDDVNPLPKELSRHLVLHAGIIEEVVQACLTGDRKLLIQALERDPLLQNMQQDKIPEMVGRLLDVHKEYVHPGFF